MKTLEIIVFGKVQGVWFRKYTQEKASKIGVVGWVKNQKNGTVKILAQAGNERLEQLIKWCHLGSPKSEVSKVEVNDIKVEPVFKSFEIKN